jgi:hypothetical protein
VTTLFSAQAVGDKRSRSSVDEPVGLSLATALPLSVWKEHLTPRLTVVDAARLRGVCKALRAVVHDCPVELGNVRGDKLKAALTCFPAAKSLSAAGEGEWVELLGRHGASLKRITADEEGVNQLLVSAAQAGALPKLNYFKLKVSDPEQRQLLADGHLLEKRLTVAEEHLSALELLRGLLRLQILTLVLTTRPPLPDAFPAFIPPSLKTLKLGILPVELFRSLVRDLPSMLQASGARLRWFEVMIDRDQSIEGGAALARVFQACAPTLRTLAICGRNSTEAVLDPAVASEVALGVLSCSQRLQYLGVTWTVLCSLPRICPIFTRLTCLHLYEARLTEPATAMDFPSLVWALVASGMLPAVSDLRFDGLQGLSWWSQPGGRRIARALEAVAGRLIRLDLGSLKGPKPPVPPVAACHELGVAIGKMRRLKYLTLALSEDGQSYQALARGLAASGGCTRLFELRVYGVRLNVDMITREPSLILPSVRRLQIDANCTDEEEAALLLCCGLVRTGYKYRLERKVPAGEDGATIAHDACMRRILSLQGINLVSVK